MANRYNYNLDYIKTLMQKVNDVLTSGNLSKEREEYLLGDKENLENLLKRDYRFYKECYLDQNVSLTEAKERYIRILMEAAKGISKKDRAFFRNLYDSQMFEEIPEHGSTHLPVDEIMQVSFDTYKKYSPSLLSDARHLVEDPNTCHIVISKKVEEPITKSIYLTRDSFVLYNPTHEPNVLIHEMQHAIEFSRFLDDSPLEEYGPITHELLFLKELQNQTKLTVLDPITERIDDTACHLPVINAYFILMDMFEKYGTSLPDDTFVELIMDVMAFDTRKEATDHIYDDPGEDLNLYLNYVVSFLKAIETLYYIKDETKDHFPYIERQLKKKQVDLLNEDEAFPIYRDFVDGHDKGILRY